MSELATTVEADKVPTNLQPESPKRPLANGAGGREGGAESEDEDEKVTKGRRTGNNKKVIQESDDEEEEEKENEKEKEDQPPRAGKAGSSGAGSGSATETGVQNKWGLGSEYAKKHAKNVELKLMKDKKTYFLEFKHVDEENLRKFTFCAVLTTGDPGRNDADKVMTFGAMRVDEIDIDPKHSKNLGKCPQIAVYCLEAAFSGMAQHVMETYSHIAEIIVPAVELAAPEGSLFSGRLYLLLLYFPLRCSQQPPHSPPSPSTHTPLFPTSYRMRKEA
jgi:hypothetical protein